MTISSPTVADGQPAKQGSTVIASAMTLFGGQLAIKVVSFLFSVVVIRHLGGEQYGKYAVCVAFGSLFTVFSDLGLATLTVKRIARDRSETASLFSNIFVLRLLLALAVVITTSLAAWVIGYESEIRLGILIASLGLISYALHGSIDAVVMGQERFRFSALLAVATQAVMLVLASVLVFKGSGFLGLLAAATVSAAIVAIVAYFRLSGSTNLRAPVTPANWGRLIRSATPFAATTLALAVSYRADAVILSGFASSKAIGEYAVAYGLVFTFVTLSHSINLALFPAMTRQQASDPIQARDLFRRGFTYLLFVSLPVAVVVSLMARDIITLLYGDNLSGAARPLVLLIWAVPLMYVSEFLGYVAIVVDRERLVARANWLAAGTNIALNLALIPFLGVMAAAATAVMTEVVLVGQYVVALRRTGVFEAPRDSIGRTSLAVIAPALVVLLLTALSIHVVFTGIATIVAYLAASRLTGIIGPHELAVVRSYLRR